MTIIRDEKVIQKLLRDKLIGKQILQIDVQGIWSEKNGDLNLDNVTSIHIEGGLVLALCGSSRIDDCEVSVTISDDLETLRSNSDYDYKRVWVA